MAAPGAAPPGFSNALGPPAELSVDGHPIAFANVFARRLPNTDATQFTLVRSAEVTCETLPAPSDTRFAAAITVSRFFVPEPDGKPSKRPLSVSAALIATGDGKLLTLEDQNLGPLSEPFVEPTTATVMFGRLDLQLAGHVSLKGTLMAQVCLPQSDDKAIENGQAALTLTYLGTRLRVRGATLLTSATGADVLRISTTPLACEPAPRGDLEVHLTIDKQEGKEPRIAVEGLAVESSQRAKLAWVGSAEVRRKAAPADFDLAIDGTLGGAKLSLSGPVSARRCPR